MPDHVVCPTTEYTLRDQELMKSAGRYFAWQARLVTRELGRRVVEVGCGVGNFTRYLLDRELVAAIDIQSGCIEQLLRNLDHPVNVTTRKMDVMDPEFVRFREFAIDSIVCMNVLEHVRDDSRALHNMAAVLGPGGKAVLIVPAFEALYGPIDHLLGHYRRYSPDGLRRLAVAAGFEVARLRYMNAIGCIGWWINAKILKRAEQSEKQIRIFDRLVVPPQAWLEERLEPPFGQSLFAVLLKPTAAR